MRKACWQAALPVVGRVSSVHGGNDSSVHGGEVAGWLCPWWYGMPLSQVGQLLGCSVHSNVWALSMVARWLGGSIYGGMGWLYLRLGSKWAALSTVMADRTVHGGNSSWVALSIVTAG